jgi:hypothetical protein
MSNIKFGLITPWSNIVSALKFSTLMTDPGGEGSRLVTTFQKRITRGWGEVKTLLKYLPYMLLFRDIPLEKKFTQNFSKKFETEI